jgi:UDP-N-acetylglucosamine--N-acetylmuramyl-(pentapeptide) pyrophosphoryl-undecaprenol N-acetylglucosamine transferase
MNVLLAGGGTGGHVYPALALAEALRRRDPAARVLFVGSSAGMEARLVPAAGIPFSGLAVRPPRSGAPGRVLLSLASGGASVAQAAVLVARFRPDAIVATGGIAAAPPVVAGAALRVPVVVLEGNAIPGRVNRLLARWARAVAVTSEDAAARVPGRRAVVTGLPVRREVATATRDEGIRSFGLDPSRRTVLVLGGSQGAARLNAAVEEAVGRLRERRDIQVLHQVGLGWAASPHGRAPAGREAREVGRVRYLRVPYLDRVGPAYACADLVVSRCGATTLAEVTACGRPAILVPYRHAAEDHQALNAAPLVRAGAAVLVPDLELSGEVLAREIAAALDTPGRLGEMAARARALGRPDAADRVLDLVAALVRRPAVQEVRG